MKEIIVSDQAPKPIGPYSQAVMANGFLDADKEDAVWIPRPNYRS